MEPTPAEKKDDERPPEDGDGGVTPQVTHDEVVVTHQEPPATNPWRIALLLALLAAFFLIGHVTGATEYLTRDRIRAFMTDLGWVGFLLYLVVFAVGELMHIPGVVFMIAAVIAYGSFWGGVASLLGGLLSVSFTFVLVRRVGGQPLGAIRWKAMRRVLGWIDERPILVVTLLRLMFWLSPFLNYALAMTRVRFREYFIGSVLGFAPWAFGVAFATDQFLAWVD